MIDLAADVLALIASRFSRQTQLTAQDIRAIEYEQRQYACDRHIRECPLCDPQDNACEELMRLFRLRDEALEEGV